jgi:hypothetical protein
MEPRVTVGWLPGQGAGAPVKAAPSFPEGSRGGRGVLEIGLQ